ncbi:MAG: hypothetical protein E6Q40_08850 [Cupriavidus sp.]|nr:MAG: hypothetical protein E6Q40_08850 [Cupriavidus sp.]
MTFFRAFMRRWYPETDRIDMSQAYSTTLEKPQTPATNSDPDEWERIAYRLSRENAELREDNARLSKAYRSVSSRLRKINAILNCQTGHSDSDDEPAAKLWAIATGEDRMPKRGAS